MEKLFMAMLKNMGFDAETVQAKVYEAVSDIQSMKASQDRCEAMLNVLVAYIVPPEVGIERGALIPVADPGLLQAYVLKSDADAAERDRRASPAVTTAQTQIVEAGQ